MSEQYLLECKCGRTTPVGASQAGGEVRCGCGKKLDVPPLRTLRKQPLAEASSTTDTEAWSARQQLWVVGGMLVVAGLVLAAYTHWNKPPPPNVAVADELIELNERVKQEAPKLTLNQALEKFVQYSNAPLRTLDQIVETHKFNQKYHEDLARNKYWSIVGWALIGLGIVLIASTHIMAASPQGPAHSSKLRKGGHLTRHT